MPIRDFTCSKCEHKFEAIVIREDEKVTCEKCGSDELQQELALFGGYHINGPNGASQRPKQAGSFKGKK